jgi:hypothetical protein
VAVEKLARHEFAEIASRREALRTIFPNLLDIFYHPIFDFFQKNRLFQQPQDFATPIAGLILAPSFRHPRIAYAGESDRFAIAAQPHRGGEKQRG